VAESPRLKEFYEKELRPKLMERFGYTNIYEVPTIVKVNVNTGISEAQTGGDAAGTMESAMTEIAQIVGQRPCMTRAKKSIASFHVREGQLVGCRVTARGRRAWELLDRLFSIALPRIRDFRGLSRNSFDGRGNYSLGIDDQLIFPELDYDDVKTRRGMDITIVTTAKTDEEGMGLLEGLGLPLARSEATS